MDWYSKEIHALCHKQSRNLNDKFRKEITKLSGKYPKGIQQKEKHSFKQIMKSQ